MKRVNGAPSGAYEPYRISHRAIARMYEHIV